MADIVVEDEVKQATFASLVSKNIVIPVYNTSKGLHEILCKSCESLKFVTPSAIQREAIPHALEGSSNLTVMSARQLT